jgi:hypothetical protein
MLISKHHSWLNELITFFVDRVLLPTLQMVTTRSIGLHGRPPVLSLVPTTTHKCFATHYRPYGFSTRNSSSSSTTRSSTPEQQQTSDAQGGVALNEDMLSQLRAAQEEAARLKLELAQLQQKASANPSIHMSPQEWPTAELVVCLASNQAPQQYMLLMHESGAVM